MKLVSIWPFSKRLWERISVQIGMVVFMGSTTNSAKALFIVAIVSFLVLL